MDLQADDSILEQPSEQVTPRGQLPFSFSKKHELVISYNGELTELCYKKKLDASLLFEVRRVIGHPFSLTKVNSERFDHLVTIAYQSSSSQAQQLMEDMKRRIFILRHLKTHWLFVSVLTVFCAKFLNRSVNWLLC